MRKKPLNVSGKITIPLAALAAFTAASFTSKSYAQVKADTAIFSEKPAPATDSRLFRGWLSESWKGAKKKYGATLGEVGLPSRLTVKAVGRTEYELLLAVDAQVQLYPAQSCGIIIKALSGDSLSIVYPDDRELSQADAKRLASYAYLLLALGGPEKPGRHFWNPEAIPLLYSNSSGGKVRRKCSTGEALAGFAAFFLDHDDELQFLRAVAEGDEGKMKGATDGFLGKGAWGTICGAQLSGSTELREIIRLMMQRQDWKAQIEAYIKFMEGKFGIDAGTVKFSY